MLVLTATVLLVLWLLAFVAFDVTAFIHIALVAGVALLLLHWRLGVARAAFQPTQHH